MSDATDNLVNLAGTAMVLGMAARMLDDDDRPRRKRKHRSLDW